MGSDVPSRLGRSPRIKPYTDLRINELAEEGVKRVVVLSPSFVAIAWKRGKRSAFAPPRISAHTGAKSIDWFRR
jgi:ferrochelatase